MVGLLSALLLLNAMPLLASTILPLDSPGVVVLLRHARAPGVGDPPDMRLDHCASQRNLDADGKAQAHRIGVLLRRAGLSQVPVFTSPWCRCRDTARLLALGPVTDLPVLGSFFQESAQGVYQTKALRQWLTTQPLAPLVLVTHQVNITALTGIYPASGEMVALRRTSAGELEVLGRLATE
jgi:phosphohistidine phosphatase SixA